MLHKILVPISSSDIGGKSGIKSGPVTLLQDGHQRTQATKAVNATVPSK